MIQVVLTNWTTEAGLHYLTLVFYAEPDSVENAYPSITTYGLRPTGQ